MPCSCLVVRVKRVQVHVQGARTEDGGDEAQVCAARRGRAPGRVQDPRRHALQRHPGTPCVPLAPSSSPSPSPCILGGMGIIRTLMRDLGSRDSADGDLLDARDVGVDVPRLGHPRPPETARGRVHRRLAGERLWVTVTYAVLISSSRDHLLMC